jgi:hypothetical protein
LQAAESFGVRAAGIAGWRRMKWSIRVCAIYHIVPCVIVLTWRKSPESTISLAWIITLTEQYEHSLEESKMPHTKIMDVKDHLMRNVFDVDFINNLKQEIEEKLHDLNDTEGSCGKSDVIQLIIAIEKCKLRFLHGEISAMQLYNEVDVKLNRFKRKHPRFNFLNDSVVNAYYS